MNEKLRNLKNKKVIFLVISIIIAFTFGMFFASSLKGKEEKVKETHGNTKYAKEYLACIEVAKIHFEIDE